MPSLFDWSSTAGSNTSVDGNNIDEGCAPGGLNNAIRSVMALVRGTFGSIWQAILATTTLADARTQLGLGSSATMAEMTAAQFRANTADKILSTDTVWDAAGTVALTPGTNVAVDMNSGFNFSLAMGGNYTLSNPTNTKDNQSGVIYIVQDATGSRTLAYGANWKFAGGLDPALSTAPNTVDMLSYTVRNSTFIVASLTKAYA